MDEMNSKKSFRKGLLVGILSTVVVVVLLLNVLLLTTGLGKVIQLGTTVSGQSTDAASTQAVMNKLEYIKSMVKSDFLFSIDDTKTADGIYKGYMEGLDDPYSVYYTADEYKSLMESTSGSYSGIGVMVQQDKSTGVVTVVKVFENSPGAQAGMQAGDIIYKIDDKEVTGEDLNTIVTYIKGETGTTVNIQVYRTEAPDYITLTVERRNIEVPTITHKMMDNQIGYIQVTEFDNVTADQYKAAIDDLTNQGMKGMVVDIRDNPGGVLDTVVDMLDRMLPEGKIVYTEDKNGEGDVYTSDAANQFTLPLAVLVNENSASASEIFAGAIKDYGTGTIIGKTTYGKGIVQSVRALPDGTAIKLTISRYFTPNGTCIHEVGVTPDIEVDIPDEYKKNATLTYEQDTQLQAAVANVLEKINNTNK